MKAVKSGLDHMLKTTFGVDTEELARFGNEVGQLLANFRDSLVRIEERLGRIERRLDGSGYYRQGAIDIGAKSPPARGQDYE